MALTYVFLVREIKAYTGHHMIRFLWKFKAPYFALIIFKQILFSETSKKKKTWTGDQQFVLFDDHGCCIAEPWTRLLVDDETNKKENVTAFFTVTKTKQSWIMMCDFCDHGGIYGWNASAVLWCGHWTCWDAILYSWPLDIALLLAAKRGDIHLYLPPLIPALLVVGKEEQDRYSSSQK